MPETPVSLESIEYRRVFPWLHLLRAFWIAVDIRKLILAGAALMLISGGSLVFDRLPFGRPSSEEEAQARDAGRWPWQQSLGYDLWHGGEPLSELRGAMADPRNTLARVLGNWQVTLTPLRSMLEPAVTIFRGDATWPALADAVTRLAWALLVWSLFGGAIARMAAVQFARDQSVGVRRALAFAGTRFLGYVSAPLLPFVGVGVLWLLCIIGGWLGKIPGGAGPVILGILWGLEVVFGFLMAVVLVGLAAGWPLMFATISVEGTDGFDGLSRAYNYVFERPLYYLWQAVLAMLYGSVAIFFVWLVCQAAAYLAVWGVSWGGGYDATVQMIEGSPPLLVGGDGPPAEPGPLGPQIARGWMCALATVVLAFVHTFFWSCATIIYFTLRRSVDANDFDEVYVDDNHEQDELLPLVGAAAMGETATIAPPSEPAAPPDAAAKPPYPPPVDLAP